MTEIAKKRRGRPHGSQNRATKEIREKISWAFDKVAGASGEGLVKLATDEPAIFYGLVAKIIPIQAQVQVTHTLVSLGDAMLAAQTRLEGMQGAMIDVTPSDDD
tara:strand:+ start:79 stop:390 length:312 start_codon:yes stop_codon:yes gene_type:complete